MADEHFWDNGVSAVSTEANCKLYYEKLTGEQVVSELMTIDKALSMMDSLKSGRETVTCRVVKIMPDNTEQDVQSFKQNVLDVGGTKIII